MANQRDTPSDIALDVPKESFFRRLDWSAFWTATLLTFAVYLYTLAPTVTLEDSGELAVGGAFLGVPHPPGYPIWSMISWIFTKVFAFVTFRGQPNPAWSIGLVSTVFGAFAAGITAMLLCRSGSDMLRQSRDIAHQADHRVEDHICWIAGVVASLLFAFTPCEWSQSTIIEVYSLNAFFLALIFLLTYWWMRTTSDRVLWATAFVFGLGLTNYQVLLLAILPLVLTIMLRDIRLFFGFIAAGIPFIAVIGGMKMGALPMISDPLNMDCFIYLALNLLALTVVYFFLPRGRTIAWTIFLIEFGLAFYAYMPLVSDLRNPPMNWGFPRTWEGFLHAITRGQYEKIAPTDVFSPRFIAQIGSYFTDLRGQFTLPLALLGFLPFTVWRVRIGQRQLKGLHVSVILMILAVAALVLQHLVQGSTAGDILRADKFFIAGIMLMMVIGGLAIFAERFWEFWDRVRGRTTQDTAERVMIGLILLTAAIAYLATTVWLGIKTQSGLVSFSMLVPLAAAAAAAWLARQDTGLRMTIDENSQKWVVATLSGFLVMSLMLIVLANPKGDVQDAFIQRVKFISSHALFAFWIGYGLVFGLAWVETVFRGNRLMRLLSLSLAGMFPLIPIMQNAYNSELVRLSGGAEQNGHDFGWQFGNYQLRGAAAISEELATDEEPLPNPDFPPAMSQNAIFYGGTDPGRFVPTYMIYAARVREDVYLITQNALADNTFMNVTRDLYGDQIWIPSMNDSANAFRVYVEEVQRGERQAHAELKIEGGRVQVSGALGVMEINGILAKMIFDRNSWRHDFYVEESYVIQWMYPHLTPHGLIMKINAKETPLTPDVVRDDGDFWDWYTRRLHNDNQFLRDVVARKSFSKLRSAIGGLYANRGLFRQAEEAFHQARILYPLSPEANFRLVQEVLLREARFTESRAIMEAYAASDPGNDRVPDFLRQLVRIEELDVRIRGLEAQRQQGAMDVTAAFQLAESYQQAMQSTRAVEIINGILATADLPPQYLYQAAALLYASRQFAHMDAALVRCLAALPPETPPEIHLNIARMYADASMPDKMLLSLQRYLQARPDDWKAWLDLSYIFLSVQETNSALKALNTARQLGGAAADTLIQKDNRFAPLMQSSAASAPSGLNLLGIPGVSR